MSTKKFTKSVDKCKMMCYHHIVLTNCEETEVNLCILL
nr:MAG TPA: hypothetical protein [Caudoviricetes sp.]